MIYLRYIVLTIICLSSVSFSQSIELNEMDATVWAREQTVSGKLNDFYESNVDLHLNGNVINSAVNSSDSSFLIPVILNEGKNKIVITTNTVESDTLTFTLGYKLRPESYLYAEVSGRDVTLHGTLIDNPDSSFLSFILYPDNLTNPQPVTLSLTNDTTASFTLPENAKFGEYYFNLETIALNEDTTISRTFVTVDSSGIRPFNIKTDHAAWIDSAVIYEITPYIFANGNQSNSNDLNTIRVKIPEFVRLGVNTIWLQPIYKTFNGGQGYDVTDYFHVRSDIGTEQDLRNLIQTAKEYGLKVMFDFVPNHSSIHHPYAQNSISFGEKSHYYNFYQREEDSAPYSQHYHHYQGFINYFWDELPNLNYDNPEVQKWITEAATYWVREFGIDGYRFDAVWGVNARKPKFMKQLRLAIKRIKPDFLMLAEDKATRLETFDENFDVAFDWYPEEDWVSHWTWQTSYNPNANPTIFNYSNQNQRSNLLRDAITNNGNGFAPNAKVLHFMVNNDQFYFITHHGLERTKMAAALLFTLPGVPLVYNGQEIGKTGHPYSTEFIFYPGYPLDRDDTQGLFPYYQNLIKWRKSLPALIDGGYEEISVTPNQYLFSFRRWQGDQNIFTILNMASSSANVNITLPIDEMNLDTTKTYYLSNLLDGDYISGKPDELKDLSISMDRFSAKVYLLADSIVTGVEDTAPIIPETFDVAQNYPNPFNPSTTIKYTIPSEGKVAVKIYDVLGREVVSLVNENQQAGTHSVVFDAGNLSSGVYIYRVEFDKQSFSKKMMLLK